LTARGNKHIIDANDDEDSLIEIGLSAQEEHWRCAMVSEKRHLEGKVAIITGGGTGLGRAMAQALAREGASIVVSSRRVEPIEQTAQEVSDLGGKGLAIAVDVTDSQQVNQMVERTLSEMGRIDILINNAGIVRGERSKPLWEITDEEWHLGMDTNLSGAFFCCRAVGRYLAEQKSGKVINVASGYGLRGGRDNYMYCCAKGGVIQLTRVLALSWAQHNIQVNSIVPGFIDTSTLQPQPQARQLTPEQQAQMGQVLRSRGQFIPVGRIGIPPDIGSLGLFLASDASDYITGAMFTADGGGMVGCGPTGYAPTITMEED
jgi:NAD(P)-dependent dehydrogenase (short-subunit alcohol dehydrogenase family)